MRPPSAPDLLNAWEHGLGQPPPARALALLAAAWPGASPEAVARLPVGSRDACLLALRELAFGSRLLAATSCPACGEELEVAFHVADIRVVPTPDRLDPGGPLTIHAGGRKVRFRLPDSLDLLAATVPGDPAGTRRALLERCLAGPQAGELPPEVVEAIEARMAEADPQADVRLAVTCQVCSHGWEAAFDIATYLWAEVDAWATRTLYEVHLLAAAYGWRETDILALSLARRRFYLEAVAG
jgi:hypothetical protein